MSKSTEELQKRLDAIKPNLPPDPTTHELYSEYARMYREMIAVAGDAINLAIQLQQEIDSDYWPQA